MSHIHAEVWTRLGAEHPGDDTLWARRASPDISPRLLAAIKADGERHFLIRLLDEEPDVNDSQSRGVSVMTREMEMPDHGSGRYLDMVCHDASGHDAFDLIGGELADRLKTSEETASEVAIRVLAKWRRFWGQIPNQMLSRDAQLGLFAEIWFLAFWLVPRAGPEEAVRRWRGPSGARHDFEWPGKSVEVKATTSLRGRIHHINGLEQLAPPEKGALVLFSLRAREEGGATNTLPSVIAACREKLGTVVGALDLFERALAKAGYASIYEEEYAKTRLRIVEEGLFRVDGDFPRLIPSTFPSGVPGGVERIEYEINLAGFAHLLVAVNAAQNFEL